MANIRSASAYVIFYADSRTRFCVHLAPTSAASKSQAI